jgi:adenylate cyclase
MTDVSPGTTTNIYSEIERLIHLAQEVNERLRSQRTMLAQRGDMSLLLSPQVLEKLQSVSETLNDLTVRLESSRIELQQLRGLARTTEIINSTLDLDLILDDVIDTVIALTGAERGYVVLKDPDTGELVFRVARDDRQRKLAESEFVVSRTVVQQVAEQGELIVTTNATEETGFSTVDSIVGFMLRSILCVPLIRKDEVIGVIYADNRHKQSLFGEREKRLVMAFANQAAVAIDNARLFEGVRASLAEITAMRDFMDNVFTSIASGVITTDSEDRIITVNDAAGRILDIVPEEAIGQSLWTVLPPLYEGFENLLADVREHNLQQTIEVDPVLGRRGQVSLTLKLSPLKDEAQITRGVALVLDDLTELKQRQEQLSVVKRYLPPQMVDNIKTIDELELGGVEREVTIMYCDVRGFTTFSETLQPEELMETINKYLTVSSRSIHNYEGIIDKFMGDAVVGLFNTQLNPQSDHALRAVQAALTLAHNVQSLHTVLPDHHRLFFGIGVHTGLAVLGNVGSPRRKEFTAIGRSLQFAKLLQENALGGEVLISQDTYEIVKDRIQAEPLLPRKSKDEPDFTIMYRVRGSTG